MEGATGSLVGVEAAQAADAARGELWARTAAAAGRLNRAHGELVQIAGELISGGFWADGGFRSPEHYLVVRAGLSASRARDLVTLARRRGELPEATADLLSGRISLDQAAVVAHHVPAGYQSAMTQLARHATVPQLRRAASRHAFTVLSPDIDESAATSAATSARDESDGQVLDPGKADPIARERSEAERRACARPELSMHYDRDGRFHLRYSAPATVGALVEQAVKEAKDALFVARSRADRSVDRGALPSLREGLPDAGPSYADGLGEVATRSLGAVGSVGRAAHYRVYLHLATDRAWVNGGPALPARLIRRFLADSAIQPVWETQGRPVSVGRAMRILPMRSRRLIEDRDRGCRFPGCAATRFVEIHHLRDWADGGRTDDDNLVSLCPFHHDAVGRGDFTLTGDPTRPDGLVATDRHGFAIEPPGWSDLAPPPRESGAGWDAQASSRQAGSADQYCPPTGEPIRWAELEIPPDAALRRGTPETSSDPDAPRRDAAHDAGAGPETGGALARAG